MDGSKLQTTKIELMQKALNAAEAFVKLEHQFVPIPCRVVNNGCTCGVWAARNEARAEFYRRLRAINVKERKDS